jgi:hypothetical protein
LIAEINPEVPQILINKELVYEPHEWDYALLGDLEQNIKMICDKLKWDLTSIDNDIKDCKKNNPSPVHTLISTKKLSASLLLSSLKHVNTSNNTTTTTVPLSTILTEDKSSEQREDSLSSFSSITNAKKLSTLTNDNILTLSLSPHSSKKTPQTIPAQSQTQQENIQQLSLSTTAISSSTLSSSSCSSLSLQPPSPHSTTATSAPTLTTITTTATTIKNESESKDNTKEIQRTILSSHCLNDQTSQLFPDKSLRSSFSRSYSTSQTPTKEMNVEVNAKVQTPSKMNLSLSSKLSPKPPRAYVTVTFETEEKQPQSMSILASSSTTTSAPLSFSSSSPTAFDSSSPPAAPPLPTTTTNDNLPQTQTLSKERTLLPIVSTANESAETLLHKKKRKNKKHRTHQSDNKESSDITNTNAKQPSLQQPLHLHHSPINRPSTSEFKTLKDTLVQEPNRPSQSSQLPPSPSPSPTSSQVTSIHSNPSSPSHVFATDYSQSPSNTNDRKKRKKKRKNLMSGIVSGALQPAIASSSNSPSITPLSSHSSLLPKTSSNNQTLPTEENRMRVRFVLCLTMRNSDLN